MAPKISYSTAVAAEAVVDVDAEQHAAPRDTTSDDLREVGSTTKRQTRGGLVEVEGDLMTSSDSLCHCVSECLRMGKGIAVLFRDRFKRVDDLKQQRAGVGGVAVLTDDAAAGDKRFIYYLVTKPRFNDKPTYASLSSSLMAMFQHMAKHNVSRVSMPQIGCGLDRLDWSTVRGMVEDLAVRFDVSVTVYRLRQ